MKPLFSLILILLSFAVFAQEPEKDVKKADSKVASFYLDPTANVSKLWEAKALIDGASDNELVSKSARTWSVKGKVYNAICSHESDSILIGQQFGRPYKVKHKDAALIAYSSWLKSKELATKSHESKDALEALSETYRYLNNYGIQAYEGGDFKAAFNHFDAVVKINDMLLAGGMKGVLATPEDLNKQKYLAAACAINANMLYKYYLERDEKKAEEALAEGRQKFPNETALLFNEINHYLKKGRLNELVDKLKIAVEKEPGNVSVRTTLGNVYDNLCQKEWEGGNFEKGNEYYTQAEKYYKEALTIAATDFNSLYSLGALYYNKAALISKEANKLSSDYSKEGTRKYNEKKAEMESYFDKALPYFEQAEKIEPKDKNTLIALKEIFAKKSQFDKSNAYKTKLESLGN